MGSQILRRFTIIVESAHLLINNLSSIEELISKKLDKQSGISTSKKGILKKLKEVLATEVEILLKKNQMFTPPFDPFRIKELGNAKIIVEYAHRNDIGADGCLQATDEGFLIKIDQELTEKSRHRHRLRSTMAHELMHTFFYDISRLPPAKLGQSRLSREQFLIEEELCYYLAREFLVPTFSILDLLSEDRSIRFPSLKNIDLLKTRFIVSSDIVAYRMIADLSVWNAIFIKFIQEGTMFRSKTKLKNKSNRLYRKTKIPDYVPQSDPSDKWLRLLSDNVANAREKERFEELIVLNGHRIALESKIETGDPVCIITIAYEEN